MSNREYCFNCGRRVPQEEDKAIEKAYDSQDNKHQYPAWTRGKDWVMCFFDPELLRLSEEQRELGKLFVWICPDCQKTFQSFLTLGG